MKILILICLTFSFNFCFAQVSITSLFPEMKSVNPGLLTKRKNGQITVSTQGDRIEKDQNITQLDGAAFKLNEVSKIDLMDFNLFRGGKGSGLTSETTLAATSGKKVTTMIDGSDATTSFTTECSSKYFNSSVGFGNGFGIGVIYVDYASKYTFTNTVNGSATSSSNDTKINVTGIKPGIVFGGPGLALGIFAEYDSFKNASAQDSVSLPAQKIIGLGLGYSGSSANFEIAVEANPAAELTVEGFAEKLPMPLKASLLAEYKMSFATIGYKGMFYTGQYMDLDKIIPTQLVYSTQPDDSRLLHIINFSFGGNSKFNFGGSAAYSKSVSEEKSTVFLSKNKHPTETTAMSASLKFTYNF